MRRDTPFVLVVDPYPDVAESTRAVLSLYGFEVETARTCEEALAATHDGGPAAVVTALLLPDGDGNQLAERMRAAVRPEPAVIALSEYREPRTAAFAECFTKPADPRRLAEVLRRYVPHVAH